MKIIFMGTPDFSVPSAEAVFRSGNELAAVITQPDRPKGRGKQVSSPPVKKWAAQKGIPVYQPGKIRGDARFIGEIRDLAPDLIVTAAFGQILPKDFLALPPMGCVNVHASLLPEYRGASPIQQVLLDGREKTGITVMYMDEGMDTGPVILQEELRIEKEENAGRLHDRLSVLGGEVLARVLKRFDHGKPAATPQDPEKATYCGKIDKSMGEIPWEDRAPALRNQIRGLTPRPGAYTFLHGDRLKVWKAEEWETFTDPAAPGTVVRADMGDGLIVACGEGALRITELQGPGGRPMPAPAYLRGNPIEPGTRLGRQNQNPGPKEEK